MKKYFLIHFLLGSILGSFGIFPLRSNPFVFIVFSRSSCAPGYIVLIFGIKIGDPFFPRHSAM